MSSVDRWDIWLANVPFEDLPQSKKRPILILGDTAVEIDCLKMTGQKPRSGEYVLRDWAEAGLHKQTTVRISKRLILPKISLIKKIGSLSIFDTAMIQKLL